MIRLLFTALLCVLASSQARAQNWVSQTLLGLNEDQRNETFTYLLRDSNAKCDRVIRTLFNGATSEPDVWEALCRDRNSYSPRILPEPTADVKLAARGARAAAGDAGGRLSQRCIFRHFRTPCAGRTCEALLTSAEALRERCSA